MELRHFLSGSVIIYAISVYLFGAGQNWGIRNIWYYYVIMAFQVIVLDIVIKTTFPEIRVQ